MGYEIGPRLRKYREAQNLSQKEFAKLIGVSNSRISNWEQGINRPDVDILSKICEVLKVSPSELLAVRIPLINEYEHRQALTDLEKEILNKFNMLDESDRKAVEGIIDSLYQKTINSTATE